MILHLVIVESGAPESLLLLTLLRTHVRSHIPPAALEIGGSKLRVAEAAEARQVVSCVTS